jgi:flagellar hook assembly protein FlgD
VARDSGADDDPRQFDLWRYKVQDIVKQRGGVTILNNVIDSNRRERTAVRVDLSEAGQVTVLVFTLDGDVVRSLHRGRLGAGSYTMTWDGTNAGGNPVARGVYFIRVVGPGIDEIRKVMVVKN